jgi:hypothetical protein
MPRRALALLAACSLGAAPPSLPDTRAELEDLARQLEFFQAFDFARRRLECIGVPQNASDRYVGKLRPFAARRYPEKELLRLLKHPSPRVRTLAAAALFEREDPRLLPQLAPLARDEGPTFPRAELVLGLPPPSDQAPDLKAQTVGQVVGTFLDLYLDAVEGESASDFDDYWGRRKARAHCASWFAVRLLRAQRDTCPLQGEDWPAVRAVRRQIDRLPPRDRALTLLWLRTDGRSEDALATEAEVVTACKALGRERLLKLLRRQTISDDPDVQPGKSNRAHWRWSRMMAFVLDHAPELLRPGDADALLACAEADNPSRWFIAAARVQPKRARAILDAGWAAVRGRGNFGGHAGGELLLARQRLLPDEAPDLAVKWFYAEEPARAWSPHAHAQLLRGLAERPEPRYRKLVAALVRDRRFEALDWQSLVELIALVNALEKRAVVSAEDVRAAWHPLGMGHFHWSRQEAARRYPRETADLLARLASWRTALRRHVEKW